MNFLEHFLRDIRKGENIDILAILLIAFSLAILEFLGASSPGLVASLTLVVLGLLAVSMLANRYAVQQMEARLTQTVDTVFLTQFPDERRSRIAQAHDVWLVGVSLARTIKSNYSLIEHKLQQGHTIRVLVTDPDSVALELATRAVYGNMSLAQRRAEVLGSLEALCELQKLAPDRLLIHVTQNYIGHGIIAVDPESKQGTLYLETYPFKSERGSKPKFVLESRDGEWYEHFKQEMETLWQHSTTWSCRSSPS